MKNTRREFLTGLTKVASGAVLGYVSLPLLISCEPTSVPLEPEQPSTPVGSNGQISVNISALSQGNPAIVVPNFIAPDGYPVMITMTPDGLVHAFSMRCTHQGCTVNSTLISTPSGYDIYCSCHQSEFTLDGQVAQGPATLPLGSYAIVPDPPVGGTANIQIIS